jgi:thiol-disulfide isomerase/thioredoxin
MDLNSFFKLLIVSLFSFVNTYVYGQSLDTLDLSLTLDSTLFSFSSSDNIAKSIVNIKDLPGKYEVTLPRKCKKSDSSSLFVTKIQTQQAHQDYPFSISSILLEFITNDSVHLYIAAGSTFSFARKDKIVIFSRGKFAFFSIKDITGFSHIYRISFIKNSGPDINIVELKSFSASLANKNEKLVVHKVIPSDSLHSSDEILVIEKNQKYISEVRNSKKGEIGSIEQIELNDRIYKIQQIDWRKKRITLTSSDNSSTDHLITNSDKFDVSLNYTNLLGSQELIRDELNAGKYILIDFWGLWCGQCLKDVPEMKELDSAYSNKLEIISLNSRDESSDIINYVTKKNILSKQGIWSYDLQQYFGQNGYPYYILITPENKVNITQRIRLTEVREILQKK